MKTTAFDTWQKRRWTGRLSSFMAKLWYSTNLDFPELRGPNSLPTCYLLVWPRLRRYTLSRISSPCSQPQLSGVSSRLGAAPKPWSPAGFVSWRNHFRMFRLFRDSQKTSGFWIPPKRRWFLLMDPIGCWISLIFSSSFIYQPVQPKDVWTMNHGRGIIISFTSPEKNTRFFLRTNNLPNRTQFQKQSAIKTISCTVIHPQNKALTAYLLNENPATHKKPNNSSLGILCNYFWDG